MRIGVEIVLTGVEKVFLTVEKVLGKIEKFGIIQLSV